MDHRCKMNRTEQNTAQHNFPVGGKGYSMLMRHYIVGNVVSWTFPNT